MRLVLEKHASRAQGGSACRVVVRGKMNSVLVEFEDGERVVTSHYAIRKRETMVDMLVKHNDVSTRNEQTTTKGFTQKVP